MRDSSWLAFWIRLISSLFVIGFLCLLYWSSLLQEERLRAIDGKITALQESLFSFKQEQATEVPHQEKERASADIKSHMDPALPNLLTDDPYFTKVLPKLLPKNFQPHGTLRTANIGNDEDLHPFSGWALPVEWRGYCMSAAAENRFGMYTVLAKDLAVKIEARKTDRKDLTAFWVHLRDGVMWQPLEQAHFSDEMKLSPHFLKKHPVTAHDFALYFAAIKNSGVDVAMAVTLRLLFQYMESIQVIDDHTFVINYRHIPVTDKNGVTTYQLPYMALRNVASLQPLPCFVFTYHADGTKIFEDDKECDFYQKSSLWAQQFVNHFAKRVIVSCGGWIFDGADERQIRFRRNPEYFKPNYVLFQRMEVNLLENFDAIWRDFMSQRIDACELSPQNLIELDRFMKSDFYKNQQMQGHEIQRIDYLARVFSFVGWNLSKPFFSNKRVRQALSKAVDTKRLIQQNLNGQGVQVTGSFFCLSSGYDASIKPYPYDPDEAKRILRQEGWFDSDGDGVIDKEIDGARIPFRFSLTYYVKNPTTRANVELISTQLKQIGIDCQLNGVDLADLSAIIDDKSFDAYFLAWGLGTPPEDPEQEWHSLGAKLKGSSNTVGFANPEADAIIEQLKIESNEEERIKLYHRFHALIYDEAPYIFLYSPKRTLVYWSWLKNIFVPKDNQELIPGADVEQPSLAHGWKIGGKNG